MYRPITGRYIGQVSVKYRPIIGQVSAKCRRGIGDLKVISADIHIDRLWTDYRPTIHRVSTECRSTVDRVSIDSRSSVDRVSTATSTDIAVDIAVDTTYSKHDPSPLLARPRSHCNERPISNFIGISKISENFVPQRLQAVYLESNELNKPGPLQSAHKRFCSFERTLTRVQIDILWAIDNRHCVVLLLLDLSAVFDIFDRDIPLKSLHLFFSTNNDLKITIKFAVESECNTFSSLFSVIQHFCPISRLCFPGSLLVLAFACSLVSFVYVSFH